MADLMFDLALIWHAVLVLLLLAYAVRARKLGDRVVAFDALTVPFVSAMAIIAIRRHQSYYLDIALVIAMLGFVQTVAATRLLERRRRLE